MIEAERLALDLISQGVFEIDNEGRVWRKMEMRSSAAHQIRLAPVEPRRAEAKTVYGYLEVRFSINQKKYYVKAHRLVWMRFFGDIPPEYEINHVNGNKSDNHPTRNLEMVTHPVNMEHARQTGLVVPFGGRSFSGEDNPISKLSVEKVQSIRADYATGNFTQEFLARKYSVGQTTISRVVRREGWAHT